MFLFLMIAGLIGYGLCYRQLRIELKQAGIEDEKLTVFSIWALQYERNSN